MLAEEVVTYAFHQRDQRRGFRGHRCFVEEDDREVDVPQFYGCSANARRADLEYRIRQQRWERRSIVLTHYVGLL